MNKELPQADLNILYDLICQNSAYSKDEMKPNSSLNFSRYGMSNQEASLFFEALQTKFGIIFPDDFDVDEYFTTEGFELPNFIKKMIGFKILKKKKNVNITVEHIVNVIMKKRWFDTNTADL